MAHVIIYGFLSLIESKKKSLKKNNVGTWKIDNKQIKRFVSDYNSSFIGFIRRRIGSNNKKVDKINEIEHSIKFDKLIFGKDQELLKYSMANCCDFFKG